MATRPDDLMHRSSKQRGFTVLELIIVTGLVALALVFVYQRIDQASEGTAIQTAAREWIQFVDAADERWQGNFATYTTTNILELAPPRFVNGTNLRYPLGGPFTITVQDWGGYTSGLMRMRVNGMTQHQCAETARLVIDRFNGVAINGNWVKNLSTSIYDPDDIGMRCNATFNNRIEGYLL